MLMQPVVLWLLVFSPKREWGIEHSLSSATEIRDAECKTSTSSFQTLSTFPQATKVHELIFVQVSHNSISNVPENITKIRQLAMLTLGDNRLNGLPDCLSRTPIHDPLIHLHVLPATFA